MKGDAHRAWYGRRGLSFREGHTVSTSLPEERVSVSTLERCCRSSGEIGVWRRCASDLPEGQQYAWTSVADRLHVIATLSRHPSLELVAPPMSDFVESEGVCYVGCMLGWVVGWLLGC